MWRREFITLIQPPADFHDYPLELLHGRSLYMLSNPRRCDVSACSCPPQG